MNHATLILCLAVSVVAGLAFSSSGESYPSDISCEGDYAGHLQGVCVDGDGAIFWSFTTDLVKTDREGRLIKHVPTVSHQGDACFHDGKVYIAVNLGRFNDPEGNADSWIYVYDPETLECLEKHPVPEVFHGAGGIGVRNGHFYVVGGLPEGVEENYVYEYDANFEFVKKHVLKSGWTHLGIQTATFHDGVWWFGCYGTPRILLKADSDLQMAGRYEFDAALGIAGAGKDHFLVAKGPITENRRHKGTLHRVVPDPENGLRFYPLAE